MPTQPSWNLLDGATNTPITLPMSIPRWENYNGVPINWVNVGTRYYEVGENIDLENGMVGYFGASPDYKTMNDYVSYVFKVGPIFSEMPGELFLQIAKVKKPTSSSGGDTTNPPGGPSPPPPPTVIDAASSLAFTASSYGVAIPLLFGADRITGNVIWSSEPRVTKLSVGLTQYTLRRLDFALALCEGEVNNILRMWIGERLVIDNSSSVDLNGVVATGSNTIMSLDLTSDDSPLRKLPIDTRSTRVTFYNGSETQVPPLSLINAEGIYAAPAYRGTAYILFEDFLIFEETLPNIYVEVLANSDGLMPRSYGVPSTPQVYFDDVTNFGIFYDLSFNRIYAGAYDSSGSGPVPDAQGWVVFNGLTLEETKQLEFWETTGLDSTSNLNTAVAGVLTNGHMVVGQRDKVHVFNTATGEIDATLGPGGDSGGHTLDTGFGALGVGTFLFYANGGDNIQADILCGIGFNNQSIGFAKINQDNQITMISTLNEILDPARDTARGVALKLSDTESATTPTFMDDLTSTRGTNIIIVSGKANEREEFDVGVICYDNPTAGAAPATPRYVELGTISCNELAGSGETHKLAQMFVDGQDNTIVLVFTVTSARSDRIAKLNPYTGEVVWSTAIDYYTPATNASWNPQIVAPVGKYAWIAQTTNALWKIDLTTGAVEVATEDVTTKSIDAPVNAASQVYNGYDNSITYFGSTATKLVTKIYVDRIAHADVLVSTVVEELLERIGLDPTQRNIDDITALTLTGYSIKTVSQLRTVFAELASVYRFDIVESDGAIKYKTRGSSAVATIPEKYLRDVDAGGWMKETHEVEFSPRRRLNLLYRDIAREYANNVQSYALPQYTNTQFDADAAEDVTIPLVLSADDAKALAEILLYSKIVNELSYRFVLPPRYLTLEPGDVVDLSLSGSRTVRCRVVDTTVGADDSIEVVAVREDNDIYNDIVSLVGVVGRFDPSTLPTYDPRFDIHYVSVPCIVGPEVVSSDYVYHIFILNQDNSDVYVGDVTVTFDGEAKTYVAPTRSPTWGYVVTPLNDTTATFSTDYGSTLRVALVGTSGFIPASAASKAELTNSSFINMALVGNEIIQFETVTDLGGDVYELTGIVRAKFGTDYAVNGHTSGEKFILLGSSDGQGDPNLLGASMPVSSGASHIAKTAIDSNNPFQLEPEWNMVARNHTPFAPGSLKGEYSGDDAVFTWQYRSRYGGEWTDDLYENVLFLDVTERYIAYLYTNQDTFTPANPTSYLRAVEVTSPTCTYTLADQTTDGFDNTSDDLYIQVHQIGAATGQDIVGMPSTARLEYKR